MGRDHSGSHVPPRAGQLACRGGWTGFISSWMESWRRLRRASVPMEQDEQQRPGDVYREIKVGAVLRAQRGRERSELAPDAWVDAPVEGSLHYVAQRSALGDFGRRLYALALEGGLPRARQVVALGDGAPWIWRLVEEHFPGAVQIVDVWHAQQHVGEVAQAVFGRTTPQGVAWAKQGCTWLVQGEIEDPRAGPLPPNPRSRLPQGRARVSPNKRWATLRPMPSACAIQRFERKACRSGVASLRRLARRSSAPALSGQGCAGRHRDWMRSYPCAPLSSMVPSMPSGRDGLMRLSDCLQQVPTPLFLGCDSRFCNGGVQETEKRVRSAIKKRREERRRWNRTPG